MRERRERERMRERKEEHNVILQFRHDPSNLLIRELSLARAHHPQGNAAALFRLHIRSPLPPAAGYSVMAPYRSTASRCANKALSLGRR